MTTDKEGNLRKRKYETQEIASNLINDLEDLERILSGPMPNRSRIRSFASILRRLFLQQKELKHIADVRLSGLRISAPDFSPFNLYSGLPLVGFVGGGGVAFDVLMTAASLASAALCGKPVLKIHTLYCIHLLDARSTSPGPQLHRSLCRG